MDENDGGGQVRPAVLVFTGEGRGGGYVARETHEHGVPRHPCSDACEAAGFAYHEVPTFPTLTREQWENESRHPGLDDGDIPAGAEGGPVIDTTPDPDETDGGGRFECNDCPYITGDENEARAHGYQPDGSIHSLSLVVCTGTLIAHDNGTTILSHSRDCPAHPDR